MALRSLQCTQVASQCPSDESVQGESAARFDRKGLKRRLISVITSPIYRTCSYIPTLQPSIVTLKTAANAEHQQIMWHPRNIFITNRPGKYIRRGTTLQPIAYLLRNRDQKKVIDSMIATIWYGRLSAGSCHQRTTLSLLQ